jgi:hypothetical protein
MSGTEGLPLDEQQGLTHDEVTTMDETNMMSDGVNKRVTVFSLSLALIIAARGSAPTINERNRTVTSKFVDGST